MSKFSQAAAKPQRVTGDEFPPHDQDTQPYESDDNGEDIIERIRAKRKREEALKSIPEGKRIKVEMPKAGEPTVLIILNTTGSFYNIRTNKFVNK